MSRLSKHTALLNERGHLSLECMHSPTRMCVTSLECLHSPMWVCYPAPMLVSPYNACTFQYVLPCPVRAECTVSVMHVPTISDACMVLCVQCMPPYNPATISGRCPLCPPSPLPVLPSAPHAYFDSSMLHVRLLTESSSLPSPQPHQHL